MKSVTTLMSNLHVKGNPFFIHQMYVNNGGLIINLYDLSHLFFVTFTRLEEQ